MQKKAIIFGGSGFIGSHVADALTAANIETIIYDINSPSFIRNKQKFIHGDVLDAKKVAKAIAGMDYVYHFAGQADINQGFLEPAETLSLNVNGTINILEASRVHKIERLVFASTVYVYSDVGGFYRASKQACEIIIEEYQSNFNVNYTILRYGSLYGPRAGKKNFIYKIIKQALSENKIEIGLGIDEKREFIHVFDAAKMSVNILKPEYRNSHAMLTGYQQISRREVANMICEMLDNNTKIVEAESKVDRLHGHYNFTPYVFKPKLSRKIVCSNYIDFGQGLLNCLEDAYEEVE